MSLYQSKFNITKIIKKRKLLRKVEVMHTNCFIGVQEHNPFSLNPLIYSLYLLYSSGLTIIYSLFTYNVLRNYLNNSLYIHENF